MEQHGNKLNHHDGEEEEHEDNTDGLEMEILFGYQNLNERLSVKYLSNNYN